MDESNMHISSTLFKNNRAGQDGGALATYVYPSNYTIIESTFTDNYAEDDGGAMFIGCAESILRVELSILSVITMLLTEEEPLPYMEVG